MLEFTLQWFHWWCFFFFLLSNAKKISPFKNIMFQCENFFFETHAQHEFIFWSISSSKNTGFEKISFRRKEKKKTVPVLWSSKYVLHTTHRAVDVQSGRLSTLVFFFYVCLCVCVIVLCELMSKRTKEPWIIPLFYHKQLSLFSHSTNFIIKFTHDEKKNKFSLSKDIIKLSREIWAQVT